MQWGIVGVGVVQSPLSLRQRAELFCFWTHVALSPSPGRLYAMQTGMKLDSKTPECRRFLVKLMDQLESVSGSGAEAVLLGRLLQTPCCFCLL